MTPLRPTPYSKDYEITDAMFGAFRSPGGAKFFWKLVAWGTLFYTIALVVTLTPIIGAYVDLFRDISRIEAEGGTDAEAARAVFGFFKIVPLFLLMGLLLLLVQAVLQAAFYRAYYRGDLGGAFPFRFGADEVRQALSLLGFWFLVMGVYLLSLVLIFGVMGGLMAAGNGASLLGGLIGFFGIIGVFVLIIYILVAFSPATALTAYRGKVHVLAARHVSKNRFWALFGSLLVVAIIVFVVQNAASSFSLFPLFSNFIDPEFLAAIEANDADFIKTRIDAILGGTSFKLSVLFAIILIAASYAFSYVLYLGPVAFFTRQWAEAQPAVEI